MSLTTEQKTILNNELANDPKGKGYSSLINSQPGRVVELLNELTDTKTKSRMITARGILSDYPGGPVAAATILDKLDSSAPSLPPLKWAWKFISGEGLDIGHAATQGMLDFLTTTEGGNILTTTEANNLKSLALQSASRAEVLGLPYMNMELLLSRN
jgi:hypothetical protein